MKFASIVPYTQRGRVWDLSREKLDYHPDSIFGLTVALRGEHVPLMWLKFSKTPNHIYHGCLAPQMARFNYAGYTKISKLLNRAFEKFHNLAYLTKFDVVLISVHDYSIREMAKLILAARKVKKRPLFFGVLNNAFDSFREAFKDRESFEYFKVFLDNCDAFLNWGHEAISDYLGLYTETPIVNFPMSYHFEIAKSFFERRENKEKIILVSGHESRIDDVASMLVAKKIQERHQDYLIEVIGRRTLNPEPLRNSKYRIIPFLKWEDYIKHLRETYLIVDMDNTWTLGRVANDAAVVGTPCIGINSGSQVRLFPDLTCDDVSGVKKAVALGKKLIEDKKFYERVQKKAFKRLEKYSYKNSAKEFEKILRKLEPKVTRGKRWKR